MMRECSKAAAYMNAQAVMASAVMFGHGDVVTMSVGESAIVLTIIYDSSWYVKDREIDWLMERCMCGVKYWEVDDAEISTVSICVSWEFNKSLP